MNIHGNLYKSQKLKEPERQKHVKAYLNDPFNEILKFVLWLARI